MTGPASAGQNPAYGTIKKGLSLARRPFLFVNPCSGWISWKIMVISITKYPINKKKV